jgi:ubiquitin C
MEIYVNALERRLFVKGSNTIDNLKARIRDEYGIDPDKLHLKFNNKERDGGHTFAHYDIRNGSTLDLVLHERPGLMEIYIKGLTGKTFGLKVMSSDIVLSVKEKIEQA